MLKELFEHQRQYLNAFFDRIQVEEVEAVFAKLLECKGTIVISGVGKSGLIAEKIAATFVSIGTRAMFLSPGEALHGDLGILSEGDLFLALSKSGETAELLDLLPHIERRGIFRIAVVSKRGSRLEKGSNLSVYLPVEKELCPHDLAPTTSTAVQLLFGDCLAAGLMRKKEVSVAHFARNHPGGLLGKKITLRVSDLMLKEEALPICLPSDRLFSVLHELSAKKCGCLLVVEGKKLLGVFTDGDLRRAIEKEGAVALEKEVGDLMTKNPKVTTPMLLAHQAMQQMEEDPKRLVAVLPVVEAGEVKGILRMHDILQANFETERFTCSKSQPHNS